MAGAQGADGAQGAQGTQGTQGDAGVQGDAGPQGFQGADGAQGATGAQGADGTPGATGAQGANGGDGAQGPAGADGAQGPQGNDGTPGATGPQGAQGAQGEGGVLLGLTRLEATTSQSVGVGTDINFTQDDLDAGTTGVTFNPVSSTITLAPGTYYIQGSPGGAQPGSGMSYVFVSFFNQTTGAFIGQAGGQESGNSPNFNVSPVGPATVALNVTSTTVISLRVTAVSANGTQNAALTINVPGDGGQGGQSWVTIMSLD